uniref:Uncharacterized protein n=2 Tax=Anguilla anguilla TaxID=7936 RepID=A0A0E9X1P9_ANGAN
MLFLSIMILKVEEVPFCLLVFSLLHSFNFCLSNLHMQKQMNPAILNFFMCLEEAVLLNYVCRVLPDIYGSLEELHIAG